MIVVMARHATEEQIQEVERRIQEWGYGIHPIYGTERTVIGATGVPDADKALREHVEAEAAEEFLRAERHQSDPTPVSVVLPPKRHLVLGHGDEPMVGEACRRSPRRPQPRKEFRKISGNAAVSLKTSRCSSAAERLRQTRAVRGCSPRLQTPPLFPGSPDNIWHLAIPCVP